MKSEKTKSLRDKYRQQQCWGMVAAVDVYDCNPKFIKSPAKIKGLIIGLCQEIGMKRHGQPQIERFAEGALEGYSAMQFIETSSITMHFDETKDRAFIDVFSCKFFEPKRAELFCQKFLGGRRSKSKHYFRK